MRNVHYTIAFSLRKRNLIGILGFTEREKQIHSPKLRATIIGLLFTVFSLFYTPCTMAQIYPVQVTPQMIPPYSLRLSEYATTSSEKLFVNILLTDTQDTARQVRLKMYLEGQGLAIQTLDFVAGATPIFLDGGINLRLSNLDLRPYFRLENLLGIAPQQYNQPLPDGRYDLCFEVYDQFSGQLLSQKSCTSVFLILNDPPLLNLPARGDLMVARDPQNIIFNWTPRHLNATGVQYEFVIKELWDTGMDPQAAFLASPTLHQETVFATTLLYGPANIQLITGRTYAWRVRALVSDGISETSVFRNDGYSEIYHFTYQDSCDPPGAIISQAENPQAVTINWGFSDHLRYELQYRKKGYGDGDWFTEHAYDQQKTVYNLEGGTEYEFRVGGECTPMGGFAFSAIYEFTTPTEDETAYYNCGIPPELDIANQTPLPQLKVGETFTAGDFPVVPQEVSGSAGNYTGWGYITLPFLEKFKEVVDAAHTLTGGDLDIGKFTRIRVVFENIGINTDYQLTSGMVVTDYDPDWKGIVDVAGAAEDIAEVITDVADAIAEALNLDITKDTKENIEQITDAMVDAMQDADMPSELVTAVEAAAEKMVNAAADYQEAEESGDTQAMETAEKEFKETQKELEAAKKDIKKYKDMAAKLLEKAIKELYREGEDQETQLTEAYDTILTNSAEEDNTNTDDNTFMFMGMEALDGQATVALDQEQQNFFDVEGQLVNYLFSKMLDEGTESEIDGFIEASLDLEVSYAQIIKNGKDNDTPDTDIIAQLKGALKKAYIKIMTQQFEGL